VSDDLDSDRAVACFAGLQFRILYYKSYLTDGIPGDWSCQCLRCRYGDVLIICVHVYQRNCQMCQIYFVFLDESGSIAPIASR
jgi:hypothetical protein